MSASPEEQRLLLRLQDLDNLAERLRMRLRDLAKNDEFANLKDEFRTVKENYMVALREREGVDTDVERLEEDVQKVRARITRDEQLLDRETVPRTAQQLEGELLTLRKRVAALEEQQLQLLEKQEAAADVHAAAEREMHTARERVNGFADELRERQATLKDEYVQAGKEREALARELPLQLYRLYESLRQRNGVGAARLRGDVSEASNMALDPAELAELMSAAVDELVFCPHTGAILVRD